MAFFADSLLDLPLQYIKDNGSRLDICSAEPANYTEATSTYTLGNKTSITYTGPQNGDSSGRKIIVDAISGGSVTATGTASHWAISKTTSTVALLTAKNLSSSQAVTNGNTFSLAAFNITIPDAT